MTHEELLLPTPITVWDKTKYKITEKLYSRKYYCVGCECDFYVHGALRNRIYFCNSCGTELLK